MDVGNNFVIVSCPTKYSIFVYISCKFLMLFCHSDEERRFMYKINQGHLTVFCIVFVWLGGPPSPVRIMTQVLWFMYRNRLGPSGGIYYPNFVPCFVVLYLNSRTTSSGPWLMQRWLMLVHKLFLILIAMHQMQRNCRL